MDGVSGFPMSFGRRRASRQLKKILLSPYYITVNTLLSLRDAMSQILYFLGLKGRGSRRRNRDFERAGREVPNIDSIDARAAANLEKADSVRDREIIRQVIYENRMLRKNNKEAQELRESMVSENLSVSQGEAIIHLAEMNRRAAEKEKQRKAEEKAKEQESAAEE